MNWNFPNELDFSQQANKYPSRGLLKKRDNRSKLDNQSKLDNRSKCVCVWAGGFTFGSLFVFFSDFFQVVPGVFPGGFFIIERYSRDVLGVF